MKSALACVKRCSQIRRSPQVRRGVQGVIFGVRLLRCYLGASVSPQEAGRGGVSFSVQTFWSCLKDLKNLLCKGDLDWLRNSRRASWQP